MPSTHNHRTDPKSENDLTVTRDEAESDSRGLRFFDRVIFSLLLAIIALTAIPYGTVEPWWEAAFECLILVLVAFWVVEGLVRGAWRVSLLSLALPILMIILYAFLQTVPFRDAASGWATISADPYGTRLVALKVLTFLCAGLLLARFTSSRRRLRALIFVVLLTAAASAIFGIVRETSQHGSPGFGLPQLRPGAGYGQFINRNHFAYLMEMALGLALGLLLGKSEKRTRLLYIAAALPIVIGLVLANSRGGILSMFSQVICLFLLYGGLGGRRGKDEEDHGIGARMGEITGKLPVRVLLIICLLGAMVVGVLWIGGDPLTKRLETLQGEVSNEDADTGEGGRRREIWRASWKIFKNHPYTGIGFGGYWVAITEYYNVPGQKRPYQAHNDYLDLLVGGGLIGLGLGAWFFVALILKVQTALKSKDAFRCAACIGALTGILGIAVHSIVDFGIHITINALVFVALIVIATIDDVVGDERGGVRSRLGVRKVR